MPQTFEDFGVKFLYPDNWTIQGRERDDRGEGVTLDLPGGGFFAVTRYFEEPSPEELLAGISASMKEEYPGIETDELAISEDDDFFIESRFYYLDLLVTSRATVIESGDDLILIQCQAESREFDRNEAVFGAMLRSLRDSLQAPE
jgi:hypothetical protein